MTKRMIAFAPLLLLLAVVPDARGETSDPDPLLEWTRRVMDAKAAEAGPSRDETMLALLAEALAPIEVRLSAVQYADRVHPEDNVPAPVVNFDPRLNEKTAARPRSGAPPRSLKNNFGYYFSVRGAGYVVLGPAALDPRSPILTKLAAEHELFHATHHVGDPRPLDDRELETWSTMFVRFFHDMHQYRQRWAPMFGYYEKASAGERAAAIERLATYHREPPPSADGASSPAAVRLAFETWLQRRRAENDAWLLAIDLERAIGVAVPPAPDSPPGG